MKTIFILTVTRHGYPIVQWCYEDYTKAQAAMESEWNNGNTAILTVGIFIA